MIDYTMFATASRVSIDILKIAIKKNFSISKKEKGWENTIIFNNGKGVKIYTKRNKYNEVNQMFVAFSPHIQYNNNLHNANFFTYEDAKNQINKTFETLGIKKALFNEFYISSIEIGVNFSVQRDCYEIVNSAISHKSNFFTTHPDYKHYRYADNIKGKYKKIKFYIKSEQRETLQDSSYFELGYCPKNIMRFETKIQRPEKFTFLDFSNMECLFKSNTEELLKYQLLKDFHNTFFFSLESILKKELTKPQEKKFYQYQVNGYWQNFNARKKDYEIKYYNNIMPHKYRIKNELLQRITEHFELKKYVEIPNEHKLKSMSKFLTKYLRTYKTDNPLNSNIKKDFCKPFPYIGIGKTTNFYFYS